MFAIILLLNSLLSLVFGNVKVSNIQNTGNSNYLASYSTNTGKTGTVTITGFRNNPVIVAQDGYWSE